MQASPVTYTNSCSAGQFVTICILRIFDIPDKNIVLQMNCTCICNDGDLRERWIVFIDNWNAVPELILLQEYNEPREDTR